MDKENGRKALWLLLLVLIVLFIPWLGMAPFNTKGEPREAIVAVSMLQSGNWILPVSFGADIPYKPPFLAWCIALLSLPLGHVTEFTSRLPSAIAVICLTLSVFAFFRRSTGSVLKASATALVFVTSIEVWRAGFACRVDMVLTAFIAGALFALWRWREKGFRGVPGMAIVCMTCAVLTKGPVGMVLPCLAVGVFGLSRSDRFWPLFFRLVAVGLVSLIVPALWYVAAWQQGGEEFYNLAMEENFGRMTGTMSYSSHEAPFWYNFLTVAAGMLPYTLLGLFALFALRWGKPRGDWWRWSRLRSWFASLSSADAFVLVSTLVIFVFYCIPKSKRSVYLLPIYPMLAYYVVLLFGWLIGRRPNLVRLYAAVITMVSLIVSAAVITVGLTPENLLSDDIAAIAPHTVGVIVAFVSLAGALLVTRSLWQRDTSRCAFMAIGLTVLTLITVSAGVLPGVLSAKSDRGAASEIAALVPPSEPIYSYIDFPMLRYYTINFYLNDRLRLYEKELPEEGYLLVCDDDLPGWERNYGGIYRLEKVCEMARKSCDRRRPASLYRFEVAR